MINRERMIQEFQHLVSIDAESYHERKMADYLTERLKKLGLEVEEDNAADLLCEKGDADREEMAGNLFARLPGNISSAVLFSSHMDTVCPGRGKKAVIHEDGRITSAGDTVLGADDAAGIAAILEMLTVVVEEELPHPDIEVLFPAAEEVYAQGSRLFDYSKIRAKIAYVLDLSGKVGAAAIAAPSILSMKILVKGKSAHAGFTPESGIHALAIAAKAVAALPYGKVDEDTTVNLGTIHGGKARNIVPDEVSLTGEIRSMEQKKAEQWLERIREEFTNQAEQAGGDVEVIGEKEFEAYRIAPEEEVVQRFLRACENLNLPAQLCETFGGSDNNHFVTHGIRGIVMACAMNEVHTTGEYTTWAELERSAQILLQLAVDSWEIKCNGS